MTPATPYLAVDADRLQHNIEGMAAHARAHGFLLRPHAKTHKCLEIARRQLDAGAAGLTVATIGEAEVFVEAGVDDVFIAYSHWFDEPRARRLRDLADRCRLGLAIDSADGARRLATALRDSGTPVDCVRVRIEIDSGHHRAGARPVDAGAVALAAVDRGLEVEGVFTFPGHGYAPGAGAKVARQEAAALATAAQSLADVGLPARVRSGGSTPTARLAGDNVTELRPGVYVFGDAQQVALGVCGTSDVALWVEATVVSRPTKDRLVLDAGSKVLGMDRPAWVPGHGLLPEWPDCTVESLSEHHGVVTVAGDAPVLGERVRVIPNHVCNAVNLVDELVVLRAGAPVDVWPVAARGRNG
ncbi:MAG: alanine racemase [Nocardioidaceae bacterium]